MNKSAIILIGLLGFLGACYNNPNQSAPQLPANHPLSEDKLLANPKSTATITAEQLLELSRSHIDKDKMVFKTLIIGNYNGYPVKVTYPCGDICPHNTKRIIEYAVTRSACSTSGGELKTIYVPMGIGVSEKEFCFPRGLVENKTYDFR